MDSIVRESLEALTCLPGDELVETWQALTRVVADRALASGSALTLIAMPALAQAPAATLPAPAPVSELVKAVDIPYEQFALRNGLRVIVHTDRRRRSSRSACGTTSGPSTSRRERPASRICSST